jgi:hypothetical protein
MINLSFIAVFLINVLALHSHSTKLEKNASQVHPQGIRRDCMGLKPQAYAQTG